MARETITARNAKSAENKFRRLAQRGMPKGKVIGLRRSKVWNVKIRKLKKPKKRGMSTYRVTYYE